MSDRLAISASFSVLLMAAYVLLGAETPRAPLGPQHLATSQIVEAELPKFDSVFSLVR